MLKMLKSQNPNKEYPSNTGAKWTNEEETALLEELSQNIDIDKISDIHNRTTGGINCRRKLIAYKLYSNNISMEEIIEKTKLDEYQILESINKHQNTPKKCNSVVETKPFSIKGEISDMKNDIKEIKNTINELVEMMKAIYEFENV